MKAIKGKQKALSVIAEELQIKPGKPTVWINITSMGDLALAKPVIARLKEKCNIVVTTPSPLVYEVLTEPEAKYGRTYYLPIDSPQNACKFLDLVKPSAAIFLGKDFLHNYLEEMKSRNIPAYLISPDLGNDSPLFGKFASLSRHDLALFENIFAIDETAEEKLKELGAKNVSVAGDPLYDSAMESAMTPYDNDIIERFKDNKPLFVAGSIHLDDDMELIERLVKEFTDMKFLIAPHDIGNKTVSEIKKRLGLNIPSYTECLESTTLPPANAMIIDYIGDLSLIYRFADFAYVGGGFTRHLHSVIEPVAYGLPIAFGNKTNGREEAENMSDNGIAEKFTTYPQLRIWLSTLNTEPGKKDEVKLKAQKLFESRKGAADRIVRSLFQRL